MIDIALAAKNEQLHVGGATRAALLPADTR